VAVSFIHGRQSGRGDLDVFFHTGDGAVYDPYYVRYNLYDSTSGTPYIIRPTNRTPINPTTGEYYAYETFLAGTHNIGPHIIRWKFRPLSTSTSRVISVKFDVTERVIGVATDVQALISSSSEAAAEAEADPDIPSGLVSGSLKTPPLVNQTGSTIPQYCVVYLKVDGTIAPANGSNTSTALTTLGMTDSAILNNATGRVIFSGYSGYNVEAGSPVPDSNSWLYLSNSEAGTITTVPPSSSGNVQVMMGMVLGDGIIVNTRQVTVFA